MSGVRRKFVLPLRIDAVDDAHAWRIAYALERYLLDEARSNVTVYRPRLAEPETAKVAGDRAEPQLAPGKLTTAELVGLAGEGVAEWLEAQWSEGRITKGGHDRWNITAQHCAEIRALAATTDERALSEETPAPRRGWRVTDIVFGRRSR